MRIQEFLANHPSLNWLMLIVGTFLVGFVLVNWLGDRRIWAILIASVLFLTFMLPPDKKLKYGIDLQGGTILVYQIDTSKVTGSFKQMDQLVAALSKRINPSGTKDITIRPIGSDRVEIIFPAADPQEVQETQEKITQLGQLEFRILADERIDASAIRVAREKLLNKEPETAPPDYQWLPFEDRAEIRGEGVAIEGDYVLTKIPKENMRVTGDELTNAQPDTDRQMRPCVAFQLNALGARKFARLTREFRPREDGFEYKLAIILDRRVTSAPNIVTPIEAGMGQITGGFDAKRVNHYVSILNSGPLPAVINPTPISKDTVTQLLGEDTVRQGKIAIGVSMIVVPVFMLGYYLFAGAVADAALVVNLIVILGAMGLTQSAFTLPGLAGLALTIGMAVDANVLIFERMREEKDRGSSLTQAVRNGFDRAWLAIFDSNLTTILTGVILWWLGSDQIKGFSVTLIIGLVANLFTAVFMGRVLFDIGVRRGWLKNLKMFHMIKSPSFDYVTPRYYFIAGSVMVVGLGVVFAAMRGRELLDIDFTGGSAISVRLTDPSLSPDFVRREADKVLPSVRVERLIPEGADDKESLFLVRTTESNQKIVRTAIIDRFLNELRVLATVRIANWAVDPIEGQKPTEAIDEDKPKTDEPSSQFVGGSRVTITLDRAVGLDALAAKVNQSLTAGGLAEPRVHYELRPGKSSTDAMHTEFVLETKQDSAALHASLTELLGSDPIFERENNFQSQVAGETRQKAVLAMLLSWVAMVVYLWLRFKNVSYGFAAVVALVHDVLVALGFVAIGGWLGQKMPGLASFLLIEDFKIDLTVVTAFMTIIGFSVNDTIVIFDRIREIKGKSPHVTGEMINLSVNQCMSRTILTSLTVIVVLLIMYIWGGPGIHGFAYAMLVGCLSGTYSTIFVAAPILILFGGRTQPASSPKSISMQSATARV